MSASEVGRVLREREREKVAQGHERKHGAADPSIASPGDGPCGAT